MATNFEFYKDEILRCVKEYASFPTVVNGKLVTCVSGVCQQCIFRCPNCFEKRVEWLYAEHIEAPKLTKRERAFCEVLQTGYIARDENGFLCWFPNGAEIEKGPSKWHCGFYSDIGCMKIGFEFITWEDEKPWAVEDLLKLDVMEEMQHESN